MTSRAAVKAWLVENLGPRLEQVATQDQPVSVDNGWPGKNLERNHVWADRVTGTVTFPFIEDGTKTRDDVFTVKLLFQASGPADSIAECDARSESYADAFLLLIAEHPNLGPDAEHGMPGVIAAWFDDDAKEGPQGEFTDEGAWSLTTVDLRVQTRTE